VFILRGGTWSQTAKLTAAHEASNDSFGYSVALSAQGSTALVGAGCGCRAAYVFTLRGGTWSQTAKLTAAHEASNDLFGYSVALSPLGSMALVAAPPVSGTGAAYVFTLRGDAWSQTAKLTASHAAPGSLFGASVALSTQGTTALVGANRLSGIGAAYVFTLRGGTWSQTAELTVSHAAPGDLGASVALSTQGTTALVAAPGHPSNTGAAYVFTLRGGTWSQTAKLTASHGAAGDSFGASVALSAQGTTALIGAPDHNSFTGAAYVF